MTWKVLNEMINKKPVSKKIGQIEIDGSTVENPEIIANKFNNFFTNIGPDLQKHIPTCSEKPSNYLKHSVTNSMFLSPTTDYEISDIISNLKQTNSLGYDGIPLHIIKASNSELSHVLSDIINCSMEEGIFPDSLKIAKIIPVYKAGDSKSITNYRPISILSPFSKIFEKIISVRLNQYIDNNNILHENQFGFRSGLSTCMALLQLVDELTDSIDSRKATIGVFIDLAKAFDTIDHSILLTKLQHYGIRGIALNYFSNYLANRKQYVSIDGAQSKLASVVCGVPQGSILGPILFLLYINDLNSVSSILKTIMFADDTNLFLTGNDLITVERQFNNELVLINTWFQANLLSLNVSKTSFVIFGRRKNMSANIFINKTSLQRVYDTKFLGVILSADLKWDKHIEIVVNKISKNIGIISKVRHLLPKNLTCNLYFTLFDPFISYCNLVWSAPHRTGSLDRILKIQKKYCRLITFSTYTATSRPLFQLLSILSVYDMYKYQLLIHIYRPTNSLTTNNYSLHYYISNSSIHQYCTRQQL